MGRERYIFLCGASLPEAFLVVEDLVHEGAGREVEPFDRGEGGHVQVEGEAIVLVGEVRGEGREGLPSDRGEPLGGLSDDSCSILLARGEGGSS